MRPISLLWPLATLALAWVSFASVVRRFHDRGKSGWWALLYFMPFIGWLWIIIECGLLPGKPAATYPNNPALAPAPTPAPSKPAPASRSAARLQTAQRVGTVQRNEYRPWDRKRMVKLAGNAISLVDRWRSLPTRCSWVRAARRSSRTLKSAPSHLPK